MGSQQLIRIANRHAKARLILAMFSPDVVQDIVDYVNATGSGVPNDVFGARNKTGNEPAAPFAILSRDFVQDDDVPDLLVGLSVVMLSAIRRESWGRGEYAELLTRAFNIPASMALTIAKNIETQDPLYTDAKSEEEAGFLGRMRDRMMEGLRTATNNMLGSMGFAADIDRDAKYDTDFLYELSLLGRSITELNKRARMMQAQVAANSILNVAMSQAGDVYEEEGDIVEAAVGDVLTSLGRPLLPPSTYGPLVAIARMGRAASTATATEMLNAAGATVAPASPGTPPSLQMTAPPTTTGGKIANALRKVVSGSPLKLIAGGGLLGLAAGVGRELLRRPKGDISEGDMDRMYGDIASEYGPDAAEAWLNGDIDAIVEDAIVQGDTFDPRDEDPAMVELAETVIGDVFGEVDDTLSPEAGGLLTRWRANRAIRQADRRNARQTRRSTRREARLSRKQQRVDARVAKKQALQDARVARGQAGFARRTQVPSNGGNLTLEGDDEQPLLNPMLGPGNQFDPEDVNPGSNVISEGEDDFFINQDELFSS